MAADTPTASAGQGFRLRAADRPYRLAMEPDQALAEVREASGSQFDPMIVSALAEAVEAA